MKQPKFLQSLDSHNFGCLNASFIWNWRLKLILKITGTTVFESFRQRKSSRKDSDAKHQNSFMLSSYKYAGEVNPKCFQLQLLIVTGDNFTKYLCLASQFLIPERAVEQPPFSMRLMQKPLFLSKTLKSPARWVACMNENQFSISCTDMESPVCPCQSESVVLHAELPQGVSNEWLYLAQCWRNKENTSICNRARRFLNCTS